MKSNYVVAIAISCAMGASTFAPYQSASAGNRIERESLQPPEKHNKNRHNVYSYQIDQMSKQLLQNELKLKDRLNRGWIRFTMTIESIQCATNSDCYATTRESKLNDSFRIHNNTTEHFQWLKHFDVGNTIDIVCGNYIDKGSHYDMFDCIPFNKLDPAGLNIHKIGE